MTQVKVESFANFWNFGIIPFSLLKTKPFLNELQKGNKRRGRYMKAKFIFNNTGCPS